MKVTIAIVGSRCWPGQQIGAITYKIGQLALQFSGMLEDITIISGGAPGVDTWAEHIAKDFGLQTRIYPADWKTHGKAAGYLRNEEMVKAADIVIAFWDGESKGTKLTIDLALKYRKVLEVWFPHEEKKDNG